MARRPVPILVVPKPGLTVRLHGVVVPALGLETTVDDELANELLEGTLDDYPVPYHPPAITGGAAAQVGGFTGAAAGLLRIASAGAGVLSGLSAAALGALRLAGTAAGAQGGLVSSVAGALRIAGTGAGAQGGLTALAGGTSSTAIAGTVVGTRVGLTGAAAGNVGITGTGAGAQSGLTGAASGAQRIAGTVVGTRVGLTAAATGTAGITGTVAGSLTSAGSYGPLLNLASNQPPSSVVGIPAGMQSGVWRFTFTAPQSSAVMFATSLNVKFFAWDTSIVNNRIVGLFGTGTPNLQVFSGGPGPDSSTSIPITWASGGQPVTVTLDTSAKSITVSGATTGNGTYIATNPFEFSAASGDTLYIGQSSSGTNVFPGSLSNVTRLLPANSWLLGFP